MVEQSIHGPSTNQEAASPFKVLYVMSYSLTTHNLLESFVNHRRLIIVISCSSPAKRHRCFGNNPLKTSTHTHLILHTIQMGTHLNTLQPDKQMKRPVRPANMRTGKSDER